MITNALSVDVEEYYHAAIFHRGTEPLGPAPLPSRVEQSVDELLAIMSEHRTRGTFFVLGEVAARHPEIVRAIAREGHEVGSHGDRHENVSAQTPEAFRADIRRAKARVEDAFGGPVLGYRAPNFSIGRAQSWAYRILLEEGFRYDSSTHPIVHDRYGQPEAPRFPYVVWREGADFLVEFPVATVRLVGVNLPIGGGGYFRLSPLALTRLGIQHVNFVERRPVMFYIHPWELDAGQPRRALAWHDRFRLYVGLEKQAAKLAALFDRFQFGTASEVLQCEGHASRWFAPASIAASELSLP